ncbi:MAG: hypothetical protein RBU30_19490 [Polyangia bacterium]|jgi:hypothetical protein|nr:hypothetical protein [Polyangia bacterium]
MIPPGGAAVEPLDAPAGGPEGSGFARQLEGAQEASAPSPDAAPTPGDLSSIASAVDEGRLSAAEAVRAVVEQALSAQLPGDASPELRARVRAMIEATLQSDPLLSGLVKQLGGRA